MTRRTGALIGLSALVSFLLGLVAAGTRPSPAAIEKLPPPVADRRPLTIATVAPSGRPAVSRSDDRVDFAAVVEQINPAVVNVDTASRGSDPRPRRRYSTTDPDAPREGVGSGFIIDPDGFILTNHHVVAGADRITVTLNDGRAYRADVVGTDSTLDVALLRVHPEGPLPIAPLGDSDELRVGEWVCAIGNPLGVYVHSVTVGVVSYLGRKLFDQTLDNYIQTDAAISVGNSGGPLINSRGEVVGITTAISSQAANIGFAIPITQVIDILPQLREHGTVTRGSMGVGLTTLTPALRQSLGLVPETGALVQDVSQATPAARAGLRTYDVITAVDGQPVDSDEALIRYVAAQAPGTAVSLRVWRDADVHDVTVRLLPRGAATATRPSPVTDVRRPAGDWSPLGLRVRDLDAATIGRLRLPRDITGVLVSEVDPAGPSRLANLRINQVIMQINRRPIASVEDYRSAVAGLTPGAPAALLVFDRAARQTVITTVVVDPDA
ncbi:MAG: trypsin-like peptidase domain-containing protein [Acidobacteriota bacterium]|jgi:serine protease Do